MSASVVGARVDAVVVLGCTVRSDGSPTPALRRRVALAARAFRAGVAPRIIASGGRRWGEHVEALVMLRELRAAGVPEDAVVLELCSLTTVENCAYTARLLETLGGKRALVATCGWHLPRALEGFRSVGIDAVAPPASWLPAKEPRTTVRWRERACAWADALLLRRWQPSAGE
jgi:uncharacterized SAM-binding protein YcdF (DUF218 family)